MRINSSTPLIRNLLFTALTIGVVFPHDIFASNIPCENTLDCINTFKTSGSTECKDGFCTNPFRKGCLYSKAHSSNTIQDESFTDDSSTKNSFDTFGRRQLKNLNQDQLLSSIRTCNSDDGQLNVLDHHGYSDIRLCRKSSFDYEEVVIAPGNWESTVLIAWIYQIILSEILHVPVTLEFGHDVDSNIQPAKEAGSFYDEFDRFVYASSAYPFEYLQEATRVDGKCSATDEFCAHVLPEVWSGADAQIQEHIQAGNILYDEKNGFFGGIGFYVPLLTVERDWTLATHHGLKDRLKLADRFKTPTTFGEYCEDISSSNCTSDLFAKRPPIDEEEKSKYFIENVYSGFFRTTFDNDCSVNENCVGHFVNAPCSWTTFADSQFYWNNITLASAGPLEPNNGYSYGDMIQIIMAANATKSDIIFWWWQPDILPQEFENTDMEFVRVTLPRSTEECVEYRASGALDKCSTDVWERRGDPIGACDYKIGGLKKIMSKGLQLSTYSTNEVERSPALEVLKNVELPELALDEIFQKWFALGIDRMGYDGREAVCDWVYEHAEYFNRFIPHSYPREVSDREFTVLFRFALAFGVIAFVVLLATAGLTWYWRKEQVMRYAQVDVLCWYVLGRTVVNVAAISNVVEKNEVSCVLQDWGVMLGITMELVPLLTKVSAINKITTASMHFQRVNVNTRRLKITLVAVLSGVLLYLIIWTVVDRPTPIPFYNHDDVHSTDFNDDKNAQIGIIQAIFVKRDCACESKSQIWKLLRFAWEFGLLLSATVLAVQSRDVISELNESKYLIFVIYGHFLFLIMRLVLYVTFLSNSLVPGIFQGVTSIVLSVDSICAICIYFIPKFWAILLKMPPQSATHPPSNPESNNNIPTKRGSYTSHSPRVGNKGPLTPMRSSMRSSMESSGGKQFSKNKIDRMRSSMSSAGRNNSHGKTNRAKRMSSSSFLDRRREAHQAKSRQRNISGLNLDPEIYGKGLIRTSVRRLSVVFKKSTNSKDSGSSSRSRATKGDSNRERAVCINDGLEDIKKEESINGMKQQESAGSNSTNEKQSSSSSSGNDQKESSNSIPSRKIDIVSYASQASIMSSFGDDLESVMEIPQEKGVDLDISNDCKPSATLTDVDAKQPQDVENIA
ncbi:hypothetical protein CTEN210_04244 [Chaetoceros tenuissimus]|uniref:G-protein coupled receptors family 3 profile domain-containing protein n=1 Tax=Chaetoceros tenuissimus TaxID=426638 RepID=A0AAD3CLA0_9STRA|nr:hypothetical protein CTEN210_04244 [Chaetoceros tenuissimus]